MGTITIGIDLAKQVFPACEMDAGGRVRRGGGAERSRPAACARRYVGAIDGMAGCYS